MTKVISISDDAYERLKKLKEDRSFSEIIIEITKEKRNKGIMQFAGILSAEEAEEIKRNINRIRKMPSRRFN